MRKLEEHTLSHRHWAIDEMGRPRASNAVRDFAEMFANAVTVHSPSCYDWVARTGMHSIFILLSQLAPKVDLASRFSITKCTANFYEIRFRFQAVRCDTNDTTNRYEAVL